jgi:hypothetical protein
MRITQTPERLKEAPAHALRAMVAGVGQVLLLPGRVRRRTFGHEHSAPVSSGAEQTLDAVDTVKVLDGSTTSTAKPRTGRATTAAQSSTVKANPGPSPEAAAADLPLAGYGDLSLASLRARMRSLDVAQVRQLLDYERAHESRENVVAMFERRVAKLEGADDAG